MKHRLNDFAFRGLATTNCTVELQARGLLRTPELTVHERQDADLFAPISDQIRGASLHMQRAYRLLFVFENFIREFVGARLGELDGENWFDGRATTPMKGKVDERKRKEARNAWHIGRNPHPIYYLDFGDLGLLIINHWGVFKDFFDDQSWVTSRVQEAERTRNVIAHTNVLASEEADRLEMYLRDWIRQVG